MKTTAHHRLVPVFTVALVLASATAGAQPQGDYLMQGLHQTNLHDDVIASPLVRGFHVRDGWEYIGSGDWSYFDSQLARAARLDKEITIGIYDGKQHWPKNHSPAAYDALIAAFGARYNANPLIDAVHMSCPDSDASMEMFLHAGVSDAQAITDWKHTIDDFSAAFPAKSLILDLAPAGKNNDVTIAVADYAAKTLGNRFCPSMDSLHPGTSPNFISYALVKQYDLLGFDGGFEMLGPSTDTSRFGGKFSAAIALGNAAGAKWYQMYQSDLANLSRQPSAISSQPHPTPEPATITDLAIAAVILTIYAYRRKRAYK